MTNEDYQIKGFRMKKYLFLLLILTSMSIYSQKNMKKIINTENAPSPVGPYNQAILTDDTLYVSGQVALDTETKELVRGTRAQALATTLTGANAGNVREDNITMVGIGYNMGGGVSTYIQLNNMDHTDGDHATTEVDPQVLFAGISLGF